MYTPIYALECMKLHSAPYAVPIYRAEGTYACRCSNKAQLLPAPRRFAFVPLRLQLTKAHWGSMRSTRKRGVICMQNFCPFAAQRTGAVRTQGWQFIYDRLLDTYCVKHARTAAGECTAQRALT